MLAVVRKTIAEDAGISKGDLDELDELQTYASHRGYIERFLARILCIHRTVPRRDEGGVLLIMVNYRKPLVEVSVRGDGIGRSAGRGIMRRRGDHHESASCQRSNVLSEFCFWD